MAGPIRFWEASSEPGGVIRVARTRAPYESLDEVHAGYEDLFAQLDSIGPAVGLLIDLRDAPPARNDEGFERIHRDYRPRWFAPFERVAALVRTAAGMMQLSRMSREDGGSFRAFDDETGALAWLSPGAD